MTDQATTPDRRYRQWTDKLTEQFRKLCDRGLHYSEIGNELGISRNAAIGKAQRLGITNGNKPYRAGTKAGPRRNGSFNARRAHSAAKAKATPLPPVDMTIPDYAEAPCSFQQLSDQTCRWPLGDPQHQDFHFCGGKPLLGRPYCPRHEARSRAR